MHDSQPKKIDRDCTGKFLPGKSANPKGREPGTKNKPNLYREQLASGAEDVIRAVISTAKNGNPLAQKLVLERLIPLARDTVVMPAVAQAVKSALGVQEAGAETLQAITAGEITPEQGLALIQAIATQSQLIEHGEMRQMLDNIKSDMDKNNAK